VPNVGDVIVRFLGDTTQIDQAFDQVDARQKQSASTAAASSVELKAAQAELRSAMAEVTAEGGATADNMDRLGVAEERVAIAAAEAKEAHLALREELGLGGEKASYFGDALGEATSKLAGMLGLMALAEGAHSFVENLQQGVLQLQNLSEKTGVNITTLAGLQHMSESTGISFEKVSGAMVRLQNAQVLAVEGSKKQQQAFEHMGISVDELKHMNTEELFFRIGDAIGKSGQHAIDTNTAMTLMGRGASDVNILYKDFAGTLRQTAEEEGKLTGITDQAGQAAKEWERASTAFTTSLKSGAIPVMQAMVPVMKTVFTGGSLVALVFKDVGVVMAASLASASLALVRFGTIANDIFQHRFVDAVTDGKKAVEDLGKNVDTAVNHINENSKTFEESYVTMWADHIPKAMGKTKDGLEDLQVADKNATKNAAAEAKTRMEAEIAAIAHDRALLKQALAEKAIDINQFVDMEIALTQKERSVQEKYYTDLIALYKKAGDAAKVKETQDKQAAEMAKLSTADANKQAQTISELEKETRKYANTAASIIPKVKEAWDANDKSVEALDHNMMKLIPQWVIKATDLRNALKDVGVTGLDTLQQKFDAAKRAEALMNLAGIKEGKDWLQVQQAKLKAYIAIQQAAGKDADAEIRSLKKIEGQLKDFDTKIKATEKTFSDVMDEMKKDVGQFSIDLGDSLAAAVQGTLSASQAIEQAVGKMIGNMAKQWAQYFMGLAIADMFWNPARAAAELAAAAALEMVGSLASSWGSGTGSTSSSGSTSNAPLAITSAAAQSSANPSGAPNVPHLAEGGLVTGPTLVMAGDARSGGASNNTEAIIPLHNREAMDEIASAIADRIGGNGMTVNVGGMISSDNLNKVVRQMSSQIKRGQTRMTARNSYRLTRRG
jgi:hypothetical protein